MEELLARARAADEDLARVRQGAKHAGDADPYRVDGAGDEPGTDESSTLRTPVTAIDKTTDALWRACVSMSAPRPTC